MLIRVTAGSSIVGATKDGQSSVKFFDTDPTAVDPLYVVTVQEPIPAAAFGIASSQSMGMTKDVPVSTPVVVLDFVPKTNFTVCV